MYIYRLTHGMYGLEGVVEMTRLVEAIGQELFSQIYADWQPPIQVREEPQSVRAHMIAFTPLIKARDIWVADS